MILRPADEILYSMNECVCALRSQLSAERITLNIYINLQILLIRSYEFVKCLTGRENLSDG